LRDYLDTAWRWIIAANGRDPEAIYPLITWNCLPKSGATQMHGHMQIFLARGMHYVRAELWRRAAQCYRAEYGAGYFDDLLAVHQALGLTLPHDLRAFVHLTPVRSREVVVLTDQRPTTNDQRPTTNGRQGDTETADDGLGISNSQLPTPNPQLRTTDDLADALYPILHNLIDVQGMRAFNLGIIFPPLHADGADWAGFPIVTRVSDRGDPLATSSDIGAIEFYATGCITADPFEVAAAFQNDDRG
jgi:hypothetical protein